MGTLQYLKDFATISSILALLAVGLMIALRSGVVAVGGDRCRLVLGNLSHLLLGIVGCLLFFVMIQQLVGLPVNFPR